MGNKEHIRRLFQRYLENRVDGDDIKELIKHLKDPKNEDFFSELIDLSLQNGKMDRNSLSFEQKNNVAHVHHFLKDLISQEGPSTTVKLDHGKKFSRWLMRYAAIFAIGIVSVLATIYYARVVEFFNPVKEIVVRTSIGEKRRIVLPDGSEVYLNHLSSISYPSRFEATGRKVRTEGEVSFEVVKDPENPFLVSSFNIETKVLGTSFIVKAYSDDQYIAVSVSEGRVAVQDMEEQALESEPLGLELGANEQVFYDKVGRRMGHVLQMKPEDFGTWEQGVIRLRDVSFEEAIRVFERTYNIKIRFNDDLRDCPIYADFNEHDSIEKVLSLLALSINGTYKQLGDTVWTISGRACTQ